MRWVTVDGHAEHGSVDSQHAADPTMTHARPLRRVETADRLDATAVMAQREHAFVPQVFCSDWNANRIPNTDIVSHHVYLFSAAKRFEVPLYNDERGIAHFAAIPDGPFAVST